MCFYIRNLDRGVKIRTLLMILSAGLLLFNVVFGHSINGANNWVSIGGYMLQPSEVVKIAFIFIGSATLDELYEKAGIFCSEELDGEAVFIDIEHGEYISAINGAELKKE